ncbi:putative S-adenosylmethionine-dependent methyltransferase CRG1 [Cyphellophora attinorum]|uniref:Putative S-adenosylmethionine-dependent methyltransferase CRG1 n=1 Tax=Cyphellophora attinorum TaxID=1664694 RepID=A0A0N1HBZ8_9EURO|nr:putative S-adenosylmethionine-dependent methyltransferase CRG1 [Phialophora attinorum]KPI41104.1 putative S-adenosylmethionine-dependent methyltransferase CRG1 [Phialophora attinorum]
MPDTKTSPLPRSNAYSQVDNDLWMIYRKYRPKYPHSLFQRIYTYHIANGGSFDGTAHDAGCGPGITAEILALQFKHLICSDHSESAVAAARDHLLGSNGRTANALFTFKVSSAEDMSWIEPGTIEMVTMSEALHWTDTARTLEAAHRVLKSGGTFAAWYYTQPRFPDSPAIERLFRSLQGHWCKLRKDFSAESGRTLWIEQTGYDCIAFPKSQWVAVNRIKFNTGDDRDIWIRDDDLSGMRYDSRVAESEHLELIEDADWTQTIDLDWMRGWFQSLSPRVDQRRLLETLEQLEKALAPSGQSRAVWPVSLLLASKR